MSGEGGDSKKNRTVPPTKIFETHNGLGVSKAVILSQSSSVTDWTEVITQLLGRKGHASSSGETSTSVSILFLSTVTYI